MPRHTCALGGQRRILISSLPFWLAGMKLRQLESLLEDVAVFEAPKIALEQFPTSAQLAARIVHAAHGLGDVEGRVVLDLGCGGGVLAIAAALLGAQHVVSLAMTCIAADVLRERLAPSTALHSSAEAVRARASPPPAGGRRRRRGCAGADSGKLRAVRGPARRPAPRERGGPTPRPLGRHGRDVRGLSKRLPL